MRRMFSVRQAQDAHTLYFSFFVSRVFSALAAELGKSDFALHKLFVLTRVIITALAHRAAKLYLVFVAL